jgi:hypothetical protein
VLRLFCCVAAPPTLQVALLDTGLDINYQRHPAFQGVNVVFKNFTTGDVSIFVSTV